MFIKIILPHLIILVLYCLRFFSELKQKLCSVNRKLIDAQGPYAIIENNGLMVLVKILYFKFLERPFSIYLGLFTNTARY